MEDDNFLAVILSNLFRKESNGDAIEFFLRRRRLSPNQNNGELDNKLKKLKQQIENCGGCFGEEPSGCHSIELVFPEQIDNIDEVDSDIFKAEYIDECIKCGELLDLEDFRLGKSPYSSININRIMKGHESWESVSRTSPAKGRKLPDFGPPLQRSPESQKNCVPGKKSRRVEYSIEEDLAILKFLLANNLHDKVGGNTIWKIVHRNFPNHSYHSLHNRFRRFILPNLSKYKGLTNSERKLFSHNVSSDSSTFSPKKTIQTDNRSSINNKTLTTESAITVVDQETVLAPICVLEEVSERNPKKAIKSNADSGLKKEVSSNKLGKTLLLRGFDDSDIEESMTLTPNTLEVVLSNLFRKESNGDAIEFYMQRNRFCHFENSVELEEKYGKLKEQIEKCGGFLGETPTSCHAIELVFPEVVDDTTEIESDIFKAEYVEACLKCGDLRNLEDFRLGTSPYDGSININSIMKGHDSWDSVIRKDLRKGRKLPNLESSSESIKSICSGKKRRRNEYSVEEDLAILKFLMLKNLHDKVEGNSIWKIVHNEFPLHSSQSLRNRFRRHILPNLHSYKDLTNTERNLFSRGSSSDDSCTSLSGKTQKSDTSATSHKENQNDVVAVSTPADFAFPKTVVHESGLSSNVMENCNSVTSAVSLTNGRKTKEKEVGEFTVETDKCVLEYIIRHKRYTEVSEMKLWKDIQKSIFKQRDWKAIKQRFHDVIVKDLESEEYSLDENVIQKFRAKNLSSSSEQNNSSDEDDSSPPSHPKARKAAPRPYTFKEDKLIIDYIVKSERFEEIRGKRLWVDIQDKVLHGYNRTWESAKNRFLRTLFKNLTLYRLNPEIISKFECGAVAERHLGGVNDRRSSRHISTKIKNSRKTEDSDEDVLPKHPALGTEKIATPSKKSKRHLFRQPIIPIPVIFSPQPGPSLPKKKGGSTRVNTPAELEPPAAAPEAAEQLSKSPEVLHTVTTLPMGGLTKTAGATSTESTVSATSFKSQTLPKKLQPAPSLRCSVVLKKLTQTELEKYGCKAVSQQKMFNYSTSAGPSVHPPPTTPPPVSPLKASRFTVEISSDLLAARLSAAGSSVLAVAQANQESGWLPLSSLSGEPIQHSEPLKSSHDTSTCTTSHELLDKFQLCSSVTIVSSNVESCSVDDEEHVEAEVPDQDGLSSDGYRTPEG